MLILTIKLQGVEHKLKYPIEIIERESWAIGKRMHVLSIYDFGLLAIHDNFEVAKNSLRASLDLMVDSYFFEPGYVFPEAEKAVKLQKLFKRHIYG